MALALGGFHESFCADISAHDAEFYAIVQRPLAGVALAEAAPTPAWRSRPVWAVLPTADRCIDPGVHRFSRCGGPRVSMWCLSWA
jgi:hypothetical protein